MVKLQQNLVKDLDLSIGVLNYSMDRSFNRDQIVISTVDGMTRLYRSLVDNNIGNILTDNTKWIEASIETSSSWGDIIGTLANQTDLQNVLDQKANNTQLVSKANDSDVVHIENEETITGAKTFIQQPRFTGTIAESSDQNSTALATVGYLNNPSKSLNIVHRTSNETIGGAKTFTSNISVSQTASSSGQGVVVVDGSDGNTRLEQFRTGKGTTNDVYYSRFTHNNNNGKSGAYAEIRSDSVSKNAVFTLNNITSTSIPHPTEDTTTSTQSDTVGARNTKLQSYVKSDLSNISKETVVGWGIPNYEASYTLGAFPFTAPKKCLFTGYVNTVGAYVDLYANINGVNIKVTNTNAYAHSSFYFVLDKGDVITFANYVTASNCTIIPLKGAN